jgi:hypothetical protein
MTGDMLLLGTPRIGLETAQMIVRLNEARRRHAGRLVTAEFHRRGLRVADQLVVISTAASRTQYYAFCLN